MKKTLIDVAGDGSCFYRALYGYILYNTNLKILKKNKEEIETYAKVIDCYDKIININISVPKKKEDYNNLFTLYNNNDEDAWVKCLRKYLSLYIKSKPEVVLNVFNMIHSAFNHIESRDLIPGWTIKKFPNTAPTLDEFVIAWSETIKNKGVYAETYDIEIVRNCLQDIGIDLITQIYENIDNNTDVDEALALFPEKPENNKIYLLNKSGSNHSNADHFYFVRYEDNVQGGGKKRFTRPKICINGKLHNCYIDKDNKNKKYIKIKKTKIYV